MPDPCDSLDLASFAIALADELPGRWRSEYHWHSTHEEQLFPFADEVWDMNLLSEALAGYVLGHHAVLTRGDGSRLCVIGRPGHGEEYLVGAMAPPHTDPEAFRGVREPDGIAVPDDPVQAADNIVVDLMPRYEKALAKVQDNATRLAPPPTPARSCEPERVVMTWTANGHLAAEPESREAAAVLRDNGFVHDEQQRSYLLSGDDTAEQAHAVRAAGAQLSARGIGTVIRHSPSRPALDTTTPTAQPHPQPTARTR